MTLPVFTFYLTAEAEVYKSTYNDLIFFDDFLKIMYFNWEKRISNPNDWCCVEDIRFVSSHHLCWQLALKLLGAIWCPHPINKFLKNIASVPSGPARTQRKVLPSVRLIRSSKWNYSGVCIGPFPIGASIWKKNKPKND